MRAYDLAIEDPNELCGELHPFEGELHQIERGRWSGRAIGWTDDDAAIWIYATNRAVHVRSALQANHLVRTTPLRLAEPARHNGRSVRVGESFEFRRGEENTEHFPAGIYLDLQLAHPHAPRWPLLVRRCLTHLRAMRLDWRTARDALERAGSPAVASPKEAHLIVVRTTLDRIEDGVVSVPELARGAGVSERTLYELFAREVGTSPYDYVLARRLQQVRRLLRADPVKRGAVTRAATRAGFDHFGQLARLYKRQFGESPRDTLYAHRKNQT
ncbi:MAG: helix-turn-helix transcriptional regulator [Planctomycetota bacterium]